MKRLFLASVLFAGCTGGREPDYDQWRGAALVTPLAKPAVTLIDTDGASYDLRARTAGRVTLLFFGYTHCPDICPVHMANLAAVLRDYPPSDRGRIAVVFVTADPGRDSLPRLRSWLDNFDRDFVGLWGDLETVNAVQEQLLLPPAILGEPDSLGRYDVGHSAVVMAFTQDDSARVVYPFGTRQADWAADLPHLLAW